MYSRPDAAEEKHQIHGTGISFSSKPEDRDQKAGEVLREISKKGTDGLKLYEVFGMDPQDLPQGFFLCNDPSYWEHYSFLSSARNVIKWTSHGSTFGYAIGGHCASGYQCFKRAFVHYQDNRKTNYNMVVYSLIHENSYIKTGDVVLCHAFQSDSYDPNTRPKPLPNNYCYDLDPALVNSCVEELEYLMDNPNAFKDLDEFNGMYSKCDSEWKANGRNGKRADVWEHFTKIEVRGPDGKVMLTLAICHGCNMAYKTGKWDPKKRKVTNNGTNTLKEHYRKCSCQHHITGNPEGAHQHIAGNTQRSHSPKCCNSHSTSSR